MAQTKDQFIEQCAAQGFHSDYQRTFCEAVKGAAIALDNIVQSLALGEDQSLWAKMDMMSPANKDIFLSSMIQFIAIKMFFFPKEDDCIAKLGPVCGLSDEDIQRIKRLYVNIRTVTTTSPGEKYSPETHRVIQQLHEYDEEVTKFNYENQRACNNAERTTTDDAVMDNPRPTKRGRRKYGGRKYKQRGGFGCSTAGRNTMSYILAAGVISGLAMGGMAITGHLQKLASLLTGSFAAKNLVDVSHCAGWWPYTKDYMWSWIYTNHMSCDMLTVQNDPGITWLTTSMAAWVTAFLGAGALSITGIKNLMRRNIVDKLCDRNFKPSSKFALPAALPVADLSPERANAMQALSIRIMSQAEAQLGNPDVTAEKIRSIGYGTTDAATHELRITFPEATNTDMNADDGPTREQSLNATLSVVPNGTEPPANGQTRAATPQEKRVYCQETVRILRMRGQIWVGAADAAINDTFPGNDAGNQSQQAAQAQQQQQQQQNAQPTMQQLQEQINTLQAQLAQQGQGQQQAQVQGQQDQGQQGQGQGAQGAQGQGGRRRKKRKTKNKKKKRHGRKTNKKQHKKKHHKKKGKRKTVKKHHKKKGKRKTRKY